MLEEPRPTTNVKTPPSAKRNRTKTHRLLAGNGALPHHQVQCAVRVLDRTRHEALEIYTFCLANAHAQTFHQHTHTHTHKAQVATSHDGLLLVVIEVVVCDGVSWSCSCCCCRACAPLAARAECTLTNGWSLRQALRSSPRRAIAMPDILWCLVCAGWRLSRGGVLMDDGWWGGRLAELDWAIRVLCAACVSVCVRESSVQNNVSEMSVVRAADASERWAVECECVCVCECMRVWYVGGFKNNVPISCLRIDETKTAIAINGIGVNGRGRRFRVICQWIIKCWTILYRTISQQTHNFGSRKNVVCVCVRLSGWMFTFGFCLRMVGGLRERVWESEKCRSTATALQNIIPEMQHKPRAMWERGQGLHCDTESHTILVNNIDISIDEPWTFSFIWSNFMFP